MDGLAKTRRGARRLGAWIAARPYAVFLLAAVAMGVAGVIITLPPELR